MAAKVDTTYNAMIIDNVLDSRMKLKSATAAVYNFSKVIQVSDFREATNKFTTCGHPIDVVFITSRFDTPDVTAFIKTSKEAAYGQDTAYILVLSSGKQDASTVALNVMVGADGLLFEPYSVDVLVEITHLAAKVKKERSSERDRKAISFLVNDIIAQVDQVAYIKACKYDVNRGMRKLRELCAMFATLDDVKREVYYDCCVKQFENAPVPVFSQKKYGGVSDRIRKKMEKKILESGDDKKGDSDTV